VLFTASGEAAPLLLQEGYVRKEAAGSSAGGKGTVERRKEAE